MVPSARTLEKISLMRKVGPRAHPHTHARCNTCACAGPPRAAGLTVADAVQAWDAGTCPLRLAGVQDADAVRVPPALLGPPCTVAALTGHFCGTSSAHSGCGCGPVRVICTVTFCSHV